MICPDNRLMVHTTIPALATNPPIDQATTSTFATNTQATEPSTTTKTTTVAASTSLNSPTRTPPIPETDLNELLDAALEEFDLQARIASTSATPSALTKHSPHLNISAFEGLLEDVQENILSYLRLGNMFSSIINRHTRTLFAGLPGIAPPAGLIPTAFKKQLECRNEHGHLLTFTQHLDYARINPNPLEKIHYLDLSRSNINDAGLEALIKQYPDIETLNLSGCKGITDAGLSHLRSLRHLQYLDLSFCGLITDAGLSHLQGLPLQHLQLSCCELITDVGLGHLQELPLQHLGLSFCELITDVGLSHLQELPLQHLNLYYCRRITDAGLYHLRGLPLQHLHLCSCERITYLGLSHLRGLPLQHLDLGACPLITDLGLYHLRGLPLQHLNLGACPLITDVGLYHLRGLPLQYLSLCACERITYLGLNHLRELPLKTPIDIHGCSQAPRPNPDWLQVQIDRD